MKRVMAICAVATVKRLMIALLAMTVCLQAGAVVADTTINFGDVTYTPSFSSGHYAPLWDLTAGPLTLTYRIDLSNVTQTAAYKTPYVEVGLREEGSGDFNPGPFDTYQGGKGGWMTSLVSDLATDPNNLDLDDKHNLSASGGRGEGDYDVYTSNPITVVSPPFGSFNTTGIWYDRDGVDPYQDTYAANTGGTYDITVVYRAINTGLGSMIATINGNGIDIVEQKFLIEGAYVAGGLSFKGDMKNMQVFTGAWWTDGADGSVVVQDITATGTLVPEPGALALMVTAGLGLLAYIWRRRRS